MLRQSKNKFILGITGNIGCGKSTVARLFETKDSLLIDADKIAHKFFSTENRVYKKIKKYFGKTVLKKNNRIDRKKLAEIVFSDKKSLAQLNRIVHPEVIREIKRRISNTHKKIIILDAALLVEAGLTGMVDKLVVVTAKKEQQFLRSRKGAGFGRNQVALRMKFQISQKKKADFANFIIDNRGSIKQTKKQVLQIRRKLWKS